VNSLGEQSPLLLIVQEKMRRSTTMRKSRALLAVIFVSSLFVTTGAMAGTDFEQLRTPIQQSPEAQTPGLVEFGPAGRGAVDAPHEFYGLAPRHEGKTVQRIPVQQSPEMQSPGVIELYPAGAKARL
jgi:hypothetical protein